MSPRPHGPGGEGQSSATAGERVTEYHLVLALSD